MNKGKTEDTTHRDTTSLIVDTSKQSVIKQTRQVTHYGGDSLTGTLFFSDVDDAKKVDSAGVRLSDVAEKFDSIETNGLKIKVGLMPVKGGFKASVNAVSKPKEVVNTTTTTETKQAGITKASQGSSESTHLDEHKETKTNHWATVIVIILVVIAVLIAAYLFIKKYFPKWPNIS